MTPEEELQPTQTSQPQQPILLHVEDYECMLCLRLLYEPCTLRCGHSFCRTCCMTLFQQEHVKCPTCRQLLPVMMIPHNNNKMPLATSFTLCKLLQATFPTEYQARREEMKEKEKDEQEQETSSHLATLPLFYLDCMIPRQQMTLNIFERRYVSMMTRCLESSTVPIFGMVGTNRNMKYGVQVDIIDSQITGRRFHIKIVAKRRFKILNTHVTEEGYTMANIEYLSLPTTVENNHTEEQVYELVQALPAMIQEWQSLVRTGGYQRFGGQLRTLQQQLGSIPHMESDHPTIEMAMDIALWVTAMINPLPGLGVAPEIRPVVLMNLAEQNSHRTVEIVYQALQHSIDYIKPNEVFHYIQYHLLRFYHYHVYGQSLETIQDLQLLGPSPQFPSLLSIIKAILKLMLMSTVASFLYAQTMTHFRIHQIEEELIIDAAVQHQHEL